LFIPNRLNKEIEWYLLKTHKFSTIEIIFICLESLGVSHDWGYIPRNFFALKPTFGTCTDFKNLVDKCHRRGIRMFFDGVFNHTSGDCPLAVIDQDYWVFYYYNQ
jgi:1,4-alpha-glucan branching enzyme